MSITPQTANSAVILVRARLGRYEINIPWPGRGHQLRPWEVEELLENMHPRAVRRLGMDIWIRRWAGRMDIFSSACVTPQHNLCCIARYVAQNNSLLVFMTIFGGLAPPKSAYIYDCSGIPRPVLMSQEDFAETYAIGQIMQLPGELFVQILLWHPTAAQLNKYYRRQALKHMQSYVSDRQVALAYQDIYRSYQYADIITSRSELDEVAVQVAYWHTRPGVLKRLDTFSWLAKYMNHLPKPAHKWGDFEHNLRYEYYGLARQSIDPYVDHSAVLRYMV